MRGSVIAASLALSVMLAVPVLEASELPDDKVPPDIYCGDMALEWKDKVGMLKAAYRPVKFLTDGEVIIVLIGKIGLLLEKPLPKAFLNALAKEGSQPWVGIVMHNGGIGKFDMNKPDYEIQFFVNAKTSCLMAYDDFRAKPYVINHSVLSDVVGKDI